MTEAATNRRWLINDNPRGRALALSDFKAHEAELAPLSDGQVRVRAEYLSFDPSQKGRMENIAGYQRRRSRAYGGTSRSTTRLIARSARANDHSRE